MERDRYRKSYKWDFANFNSHAHVERDCCNVKSNINIFISTHTLTWSVTIYAVTNNPALAFQLTRSRGAWPIDKDLFYLLHKFQLTRSRGAWQEIMPKNIQNLFISTHTLTWSVTIHYKTCSFIVYISTHTLTWSVTTRKRKIYQRHYISTHTLTWSVTDLTLALEYSDSISTHTLTWSVTNSFRWDYIPMIISTHTLTWSVTRENKKNSPHW